MQDRFERLAPYRVLKTRRGVLGSSRYACKLRQELREAANDQARRPVLVMGEPGLEKDNLAAFAANDYGLPPKQIYWSPDNCIMCHETNVPRSLLQ